MAKWIERQPACEPKGSIPSLGTFLVVLARTPFGGTRGNQSVSPTYQCFSFSLPFPFSKNKENLKKKNFFLKKCSGGPDYKQEKLVSNKKYCVNREVDLQMWPLPVSVSENHQIHVFVYYVTVFKWPGKGGFWGPDSGNVLFNILPSPDPSQMTVDQVRNGWQVRGRKEKVWQTCQ